MWGHSMPSVLWRCWLGGRKGIRPVKKLEWWGAGMVICLERDADLQMAHLMPLPLTVFCFSKIQIGFTFLVPAHPGSPGKRAVKWVCVCAGKWLWLGAYRVRRGWQAAIWAQVQAVPDRRPTPPDHRPSSPAPTRISRRSRSASPARWPDQPRRWRCVRSDRAGSWQTRGGRPSPEWRPPRGSRRAPKHEGKRTDRLGRCSFSTNNTS